MLIKNYNDVRPVLSTIRASGKLPNLEIVSIDSTSTTVKVGDSPVQVSLKLDAQLDAKIGDSLVVDYDLGHVTGIVTKPKTVNPEDPKPTERAKPARRGCSEDTTLFRA